MDDDEEAGTVCDCCGDQFEPTDGSTCYMDDGDEIPPVWDGCWLCWDCQTFEREGL